MWLTARGELRVAVADCNFVPLTDAGCICVRQIDVAVRIEGDVRVRIIHHRRSLRERTGGEVVREAERMSDFVRGQLAYACQPPLLHGGWDLLRFAYRRPPRTDM